MNSPFFLTVLYIFLFPFCLTGQQEHVLLFYKTQGFEHKSISQGISCIEQLGKKNRFYVNSTNDSANFSTENLKKYDLVIFLNTTGNVLTKIQQKAFKTYLKNKGNYFGIHAAADTEHDWPWYGKLVGAYFKNHPAPTKATIQNLKPNHPTVKHLPKKWERTDEWYNYNFVTKEIEVLLNLDETSYQGGENGKYHPIAWYQNLPGGGKSIYTGGGHAAEAYKKSGFKTHLLQCILFAIRN